MTSWKSWFKEALAGDERAMSRILTLIERSQEDPQLLSKIYETDSQIYTIALTGATGVGKSSLLAYLVTPLTRDQYLGVIAMDPRSSVSGGAFLGDRIRLKKGLHPRVFFRSFAPRKNPFSGYLSAQIMARAFGSFGFGCVLMETQGMGQSDWVIQHLADTTILVLSPESGDEIQMMKRGLIEWADIFVINKSDRSGAKALETALIEELKSHQDSEKWKRPVLMTESLKGEGVEPLFEAIEKHHHFLRVNGVWERKRQEHQNLEMKLWALSMVWDRLNQVEHPSRKFQNPYEGAQRILEEVFHGNGK